MDETKKIEHDHAAKKLAHDNEMYALQEKIDASNKRKKAFLNKNKAKMLELGIKDENIKAFVEKLKEQREEVKKQVEAKNNEFDDLNTNIKDNQYQEKNVKKLLERENARLSDTGVTDFEVDMAFFKDEMVDQYGNYIFYNINHYNYGLDEDFQYRDILKAKMIGSFSMKSKKLTAGGRTKQENKQEQLKDDPQFWNNIHIIKTGTFKEYGSYQEFVQGKITIQCPKEKAAKLKKFFVDWRLSTSSGRRQREAEDNACVLVLSEGVKTVPAVQEKP
eukprot:86045_1